MSNLCFSGIHCHCEHTEQWFKTMFRKMSILEENQKLILRKLGSVESGAVETSDHSAILSRLPCTTVEDLEEFGRLIESGNSSSLRKNLVSDPRKIKSKFVKNFELFKMHTPFTKFCVSHWIAMKLKCTEVA